MEKVVSNKPAVVSLLKVQYRMHEEIMKFPSQWFYNGELEAAPEVRYRGILDWDTPIHWIDTSEMDFKEEFVGETFGRINKAEADLLLSELKIYINRIGGNRILEENRHRHHLPLQGTSAISPQQDKGRRFTQALSQLVHCKYGGWLPRARARCYLHQPCPCQRRRADRIPE